ncbi:MAG: tetratricopeptide repeat protein [Myxococcaceae bacterium]|jgi:Tfp pilus assembly protein PilF|nr:tetratricopeptide repeat protein [Myxococcaceae bacterium]
MVRRVPLALAFVALHACVGTPPPTQRALECNNLCTEYLAQGDLTRAEVQCDLGIQFSPQYADLYVNKGLIALKRGQKDNAKELFIKALRLNQDQAQAYNNLGYIYLGDLQYGKAHDNFQRALKVNPDYTEARYNLALAYRGLKQDDKAKKELRTIVEINPNLADPYMQLGAIALDDGSLETAAEQFSKATQLDPQFTEAWLNLGNALMESGKPCDAKDAFSSCIEADANNAPCRNNIIVAEKKCKLQDKALADVKERATGQKTPESEYSAALKFREQGLVNDEERAYKRCIKYDPKFALCHFGLFELFKNRSDEKLASVACKNFLKFASESEYQSQVATCQQYVRD